MTKAKKAIISYKLYNWRYWITYLSVGALGLGLVALTFWYAPAGLREAEVEQVASLDFSTAFTGANIIDFPYKLLQNSLISTFGLSNFSVKLASILIACLSIGGFFWLISRWINRKTAVIAAGLVLSTSQFVFLAQDGTPQIMFIFWQIVIMILLTKIGQILPDVHNLKNSKNKAGLALILPALGVVLGLSVYTPMVLFLPLLLIGLAFGHPKPRLFLKQFSFRLFLPGIIAFLLIISPLLLQSVSHPEIITQLINLQTPTGGFLQPLIEVVDFWSRQPKLFVQPMFSLGAIILAIIGAVSLAQQYFSVRSMAAFYLFSINLLICLGLAHSPATVLWLPIALLIAYGIHSLTLSWMTIFPLNPYPRFFGSFVIGLMIMVMTLSGSDTLFKNYAYTPSLAREFRRDVYILSDFLNKSQNKTLIVADQTEQNFYQKLKQTGLEVKVFDEKTTYERAIFTKKAFQKSSELTASFVLTDSKSNDFDRFYVYQKTNN